MSRGNASELNILIRGPNLQLVSSPIHYAKRLSIHVAVYQQSLPTDQVGSFSESLNDQLVTFSPTVYILYVICCCLKMTCCIVTLGDKDIIVHSTLQRLVKGDGWTLITDLAQFAGDRQGY